MELRDAVTLFATETFSDVFNPATTFVGRITPFSEITNSGEAARRRILETPVEEIIPASRVIQSLDGLKFIVADTNPDYWFGQTLRHKYPLLPVDDPVGVMGSIGELLAGSPADTEVYAYPYFVRREIDEDERSDFLSGYEIYFSNIKDFRRGRIIKVSTSYYRLKTDSWIGGAGFSIAQAVRIEEPLQSFDVITRSSTYDAATDSYGETTVSGVTCFVEPLKQDYEFVTPSFTEIGVGDKAISVLKSDVELAVNDNIGNYKILNIRDNGNWVTCQCRLLGENLNSGTPVEDLTYITDSTDGAFLVEDGDSTVFIIDDE